MEIKFKENKYFSETGEGGLCYKDSNGVECFQLTENLNSKPKLPKFHLFALLECCKGKQAAPFR